ncbi:recombinase family protein [Plantactinospora sp. B6F1]|uniref:recombinase family protein n=1 Tax=Plantactinospora sp. B6F1 TaxID=3158971 RepID=UPI0013EEF9FE
MYVRQSTVAQVRFNTESTQRQYGLVGTAAEFGWLAEQIVVVDADLGVSGRFGAERDGYRQIVARMCMGEVGAVFGLEVSRFGRSALFSAACAADGSAPAMTGVTARSPTAARSRTPPARRNVATSPPRRLMMRSRRCSRTRSHRSRSA